MDNPRPLSFGILGPGRIAEKFASAVSSIDGTSVASVASRSVERAKAFADTFGVTNYYSSYEALASDPLVDAVYIATPHRFHFEQAMLCLDAGKHVLCEKSITVNADQCLQLIQKAKANGCFLMEALWTRFLPIYTEVRSLIDAGTIGTPMLLDSNFCFMVNDDRPDRLWRHDLAGGTLLDIGVYNIAISQWAMQRNPTSIVATGHIGGTRVDEQVNAILRYSDAADVDSAEAESKAPAISQFTCSFRSEGTNGFDICGTEGAIRIHRRFWGATSATVSKPNEEDIIIEAPHRHNGFEYQIEAAIECIQNGLLECPTMSLADSLANMELMDEIRRQIGLKYDFE